jgi:hypothetical protein
VVVPDPAVERAAGEAGEPWARGVGEADAALAGCDQEEGCGFVRQGLLSAADAAARMGLAGGQGIQDPAAV